LINVGDGRKDLLNIKSKRPKRWRVYTGQKGEGGAKHNEVESSNKVKGTRNSPKLPTIGKTSGEDRTIAVPGSRGSPSARACVNSKTGVGAAETQKQAKIEGRKSQFGAASVPVTRT